MSASGIILPVGFTFLIFLIFFTPSSFKALYVQIKFLAILTLQYINKTPSIQVKMAKPHARAGSFHAIDDIAAPSGEEALPSEMFAPSPAVHAANTT